MILYLNGSNRILAYNDKLTKDEFLASPDGGIWYDGEFNFFMGEIIEGKRKEFYYKNDEIRIEYADIPPVPEPEPSHLDTVEAKLDYLLMRTEG